MVDSSDNRMVAELESVKAVTQALTMAGLMACHLVGSLDIPMVAELAYLMVVDLALKKVE